MKKSRNLTLANVTKLFSLVIIFHIFSLAGADVVNHELKSEPIVNEAIGRSIQKSSEISGKLLEIRRLLKQLIFEWNFDGESKIADAVGRTFHRMRLIRQMILPITFFGGFLTAIIIGIAKTGVINMILIKGVLMLQLALILGKIVYAAKEFLTHKPHDVVYYPHPQPSPPSHYIPVQSHYGASPPSSSYGGGWNRRQRQEEVFKDFYPSSSYQQQQQPYENSALPYYYHYDHNQQQSAPQIDYGQPQYRSLINRSFDHNNSNNNNYDESKNINLSSQELNQMLTNAIAKATTRRHQLQSTLMPQQQSYFGHRRFNTSQQHRKR